MKRFVQIYCLIGFVLVAISPAVADPQTYPVGPLMCPCPGVHKPLGSAASCEEACYGSRQPATPSYDYGAAAREQERLEADRRAEEQRRQDAELEQQRRAAEEKRRLEEIEKRAKFIAERDAVVLRGSSGATLKGVGESGLRDSIFDGGGGSGLRGSRQVDSGPVLRGSSDSTGLRGSKTESAQAPHGDPMVVDARVPSALPKGIDDAIAGAYSKSLPEVRDRVRKGFQAVMNRDWNAAKAWFQDALNREPDNENLKALVAHCSEPVHKPPVASHVQLPTKADMQLLVELEHNDEQAPLPENFDNSVYVRLAAERAAASQRTVSEVLYEDADLAAIIGFVDCDKMYQLSEFVRIKMEGGDPMDKRPNVHLIGGQLQLPADSDMELLLGPGSWPSKSSVSAHSKQPNK